MCGCPDGMATLARNEWQAPMEFSREESIRLATEDLRAARARLGITSGQAATRAGVPAARYRALEKGCVPNSQYILRKLVSVCRRLDMVSVRVAYIEEIGQYANIDLSRGCMEGTGNGIPRRPGGECYRTPGHRVFHQPCRRFRLPGTHRFRRDTGVPEAGEQADGGTIDRSGIHDVPRRGQRLLRQAREG